MTKKKIMIINSFYHPYNIGGAEISTKILAEDMRQYFDVYVLTVGRQKRKIKLEKINGVTVYRIPNLNIYWSGVREKHPLYKRLIWHYLNLFNPLQYFLLKRIIKEVQPDIIHTQNLNGIGTYTWNICSNLGIPAVHTLRDYSLLSPTTNKFMNKFFSGINKHRSKKVTCIIGISNFILLRYKGLGFFPEAMPKVIFNVVHTKSNFKDKIISNGSLTVGYFGRLEKYKGIDLFIKTVKEMDRRIIKKIVICGNGTYKNKVLNEVKHDKRIKYYDRVSSETAQEVMSKTDLVIVPSCWDEPFGRVIIEAYRQGTPVVASRAGGIPEIIIDDSFLFSFNKIEELKRLIINFFKLNEVEKKMLSEKCYIFSNNFKDNSMETIKVYNMILRGIRNEKKSFD